MMKYLNIRKLQVLTVCIGAAALMGMSLSARTVKEIRNLGFEQKHGGEPASWRVIGGSAELEGKDVYSGKYAAKLTRGKEGKCAVLCSDFGTPECNKFYTVKFHAKAANDGQTLTFMFYTVSAIKPHWYKQQSFMLDVEWQEYTAQVKIPDEETWKKRLLQFKFQIMSGSVLIDDISVIESDKPLPSNNDIVPQVLDKGDKLTVDIDIEKIRRPVKREIAGVALSQVGYNLYNYERKKNWKLLPDKKEINETIDLRIPSARLMHYDKYSSVKSIPELIDLTHDYLKKVNIPECATVLEFEKQGITGLEMTPERYLEALDYIKKKGYGFKYIEIANETWNKGNILKDGKKIKVPEMGKKQYEKHFKEVAKAIRKKYPDVKIGLCVSRSLGDYKKLVQENRDLCDFVTPHYYAHGNVNGKKVLLDQLDDAPEFIGLTLNQQSLEEAALWKKYIDSLKPQNNIEIIVTEWGMHAYSKNGPLKGRPHNTVENGNICGVLHSAIRMIYYFNEDLIDMAMRWQLYDHPTYTAWMIIPVIIPLPEDVTSMSYYMSYYFIRHLGKEVLDINGTSPYYTSPRTGASMPKAPLLATIDKDKKQIYIVCANSTSKETIPLTLDFKGIKITYHKCIRLSQRSFHLKEKFTRPVPPITTAGSHLVKKSEAVSTVPMQNISGQKLEVATKPYSIYFITVNYK